MNKSLYIDLPESIYNDLREYCFKHNTTKRKVVINALSNLLSVKPASSKPTVVKTPEIKADPFKSMAERLKERGKQNEGTF